MALHDDALQTQERPAVGRLQPRGHTPQGRTGDQGAQLGAKIGAEGLAQHGAHEPGQSFGRLQGDVARKAVGDHYVDRTLGDVVPLHKAAIVDLKTAVAQKPMGFTHFLVSLLLLRPHVQQTDRGLVHSMHRAVERFSHDGEFNELCCVTADVCADIQDRRDPTDCRPARHDGGTIELRRHHPKDMLGDRHQGAGVAGGKRRVRLTRADSLHGVPEARSLSPPKRVRRLVLHADDQRRRTYLAHRTHRRQFGQFGVQALLVAMQQEAHLTARQHSKGVRDCRRNDRGAVISAHGVNGDDDGIRHGDACAPQQGSGPRWTSSGCVRRPFESHQDH